MKIARISLIEVLIGIWLLAIIVILSGVFIVSNPLAYVLGELVGSLTASALMLHLYHSIDIELDFPEKQAVNHSALWRRFEVLLNSLSYLPLSFWQIGFLRILCWRDC